MLDKALMKNDVYALAYLRIGSYAPVCTKCEDHLNVFACGVRACMHAPLAFRDC